MTIDTELILAFVKYFFGTVLVSALSENIILKKGVGISVTLRSRVENKYIYVSQSLLTVGMLIFSAFPIFYLTQLVRFYELKTYFYPVIVVFCVTACYFCVRVLVESFLLKSILFMNTQLTISVYSCVFMMAMMSTLLTTTSLIEMIVQFLGIGIGYFFANFLLAEGLRRLELSDVPKPFQGLAILFIYYGILSLIVYGLNFEMPLLP